VFDVREKIVECISKKERHKVDRGLKEAAEKASRNELVTYTPKDGLSSFDVDINSIAGLKYDDAKALDKSFSNNNCIFTSGMKEMMAMIANLFEGQAFSGDNETGQKIFDQLVFAIPKVPEENQTENWFDTLNEEQFKRLGPFLQVLSGASRYLGNQCEIAYGRRVVMKKLYDRMIHLEKHESAVTTDKDSSRKCLKDIRKDINSVNSKKRATENEYNETKNDATARHKKKRKLASGKDSSQKITVAELHDRNMVYFETELDKLKREETKVKDRIGELENKRRKVAGPMTMPSGLPPLGDMAVYVVSNVKEGHRPFIAELCSKAADHPTHSYHAYVHPKLPLYERGRRAGQPNFDGLKAYKYSDKPIQYARDGTERSHEEKRAKALYLAKHKMEEEYGKSEGDYDIIYELGMPMPSNEDVARAETMSSSSGGGYRQDALARGGFMMMDGDTTTTTTTATTTP
jgi:hypothetical protein